MISRWFTYLPMMLITAFLHGQQDVANYTIEGDSVVYKFTVDHVDSLYQLPYSLLHDFDSLSLAACIKNSVKQAPLSSGWVFTMISSGKIEIKKHLDEFMDELTYLEKFLLIPEYWNYPRSEINSIQGEDEPTYTVKEDGNITFFTSEKLDAEKMILAGSFNGWNEQELEMKKSEDGWRLTLELHPGIYEYKFIADGDWFHDPRNDLKLKNEHQTFNSILLVGDEVRFTLEHTSGMKKVYLSGSFNNWNNRTLPMTKEGDLWTIDLDLPPGKHYYKFVVDREWQVDPKNKLIEKDDQGRLNSVLLVN